MKILVSPQAFKGTLKAYEAAQAIEEGIKNKMTSAEVIKLPIADGGDGTLDVLLGKLGGERFVANVENALGKKIKAAWGLLSDRQTVVIESSLIFGMAQLAEIDLDPLRSSTYGLGEMIVHCLDAGYRNFVIGLGGSASNDGGAGMAQALGVRLLNKEGKEIQRGGAALADLDRIDIEDLDKRLLESKFYIACDVKNRLLGKEGASLVYARQKGASLAQAEQLEQAMSHFAEVVKRELKLDITLMDSAGAAGGTAGGLAAFLKANLQPGAEMIFDFLKVDDVLKECDLVITGEGKLDGQTLFDKAPYVLAKHAKKMGKPIIAIVGKIVPEDAKVFSIGFEAIFSAKQGKEPVDYYKLLVDTAKDAVSFINK